MSTPRTGFRRIDIIDGGLIAWLNGEPDLDTVMLDIVTEFERQYDGGGVEISLHPTHGPEPEMPTGDPTKRDEYDHAAWEAYFAHLPPRVGQIDEDIPTSFDQAPAEVQVGWFRRYPWCHCGEDHAWHFEDSAPGRGASLAVLVSWFS